MAAVLQIFNSTEPNKEEIMSYIDGQFISSLEALWRIFVLIMNNESPHGTHLPVHLENQQMVLFGDVEDIDAENPHVIFERNSETKLTIWFKFNRTDVQAESFLYLDIP